MCFPWSGAAGEAGRQVGDTVRAAHGADGGGEAVALTDALSFWFLAHSQRPEHRHRGTWTFIPAVTTTTSATAMHKTENTHSCRNTACYQMILHVSILTRVHLHGNYTTQLTCSGAGRAQAIKPKTSKGHLAAHKIRYLEDVQKHCIQIQVARHKGNKRAEY